MGDEEPWSGGGAGVRRAMESCFASAAQGKVRVRRGEEEGRLAECEFALSARCLSQKWTVVG